jgi:D-alanyl-D-alanine dipeptidase
MRLCESGGDGLSRLWELQKRVVCRLRPESCDFTMSRALVDGQALAQYIQLRMRKAEKSSFDGEQLRQKDNLAAIRLGKEKVLEAEARLDELGRIWDRFLEEGDK